MNTNETSKWFKLLTLFEEANHYIKEGDWYNEDVESFYSLKDEFLDKLYKSQSDEMKINLLYVPYYKFSNETKDKAGYMMRQDGNKKSFDYYLTQVEPCPYDIENIPNSTAIVTVITDGLENASKEYRGPQVKALVEELKQLGWTFAYMGTNHNVEDVANELSFENVHSFSYDEQGMGASWNFEREAKMNFFFKMDKNRRARPERTKEEYMQEMCCMANDYYEKDDAPKAERITPEHITSLQPNEIFVFGSDITGNHSGGAAMFAVQNFGAIVGQNFGLQGHSFAIPTTNVNGKQMAKYVNDFIDFANQHAEMRFLVTPIGCGNAGMPAQLVASMFRKAKNVENITLPRIFWDNM